MTLVQYCHILNRYDRVQPNSTNSEQTIKPQKSLYVNITTMYYCKMQNIIFYSKQITISFEIGPMFRTKLGAPWSCGVIH